jgi:serine/threonine protein kinase
MTPERWQEIKGVLDQALELKPGDRTAFLDRSCARDSFLRKEVEVLLAGDEQVRSSFLQSSPWAHLTLAEGTRLGDYEVQTVLGSGGMGEVYRARDLRLGREVAVKVLPSLVSSDHDRLRRFEQEARAAAALNHPNILAVFQMGTYQGTPYLVSELLEGETLREQIKRGPLPLRKVIDYAVQTVRGLAVAHEKGIVHRDLKPENLFVTKDGRVKILDFGLAKLTQPQARSEHSAITLDDGTEPGTVIGTAGYMSPEQVRGKTTDHRSDVFAFGAILYEMLAGKRAFQGETSADTMSAILNADPPEISQVVPNLPTALQRIVHRCLEKNAEKRFQSASDLVFALEAFSDSGARSSADLAASGVRKINPRQILVLGVVLSGVITLIISMWRALSPLPPPTILSTTQLTHDGVPKEGIYTDGSRIYFGELNGSTMLLVQASVSGGETAVVPTPFSRNSLVAISPDHSQLMVFNSGSGREAQAWAVPLPTGAPRRLGDVVGHGATWSPDGRQIIFARGHDLLSANAEGTEVHKLAAVSGAPAWVAFSPDGSRLRFTDYADNHTSSVWEMQADGDDLHPLFPNWHSPPSEDHGGWTPDGRYYFFLATMGVATDIWVIREHGGLFRRASSSPMRLTTGPLNIGALTLSLDGKRLFVDGYQERGELIRYDAKSRQFVPYLSGISGGELDFSRDGKWVTYVSYPDRALWRSRADGSDRLQLTYSPISAVLPRWSPDGSAIAFANVAAGKPVRILVVLAEGGTPKEVYPENRDQMDCDWSRDGKKLVFGRASFSSTEKLEINVLDLGSRQVSVVPGSENLFFPRWSPNGEQIAALTADSKKLLLFEFKTQKWSDWVKDPGRIGYPAWSRDGRYVYYSNTSIEHATFSRIRVGDSHPELIADLKDLQRYIDAVSVAAGAWSGLTPDGSPLFVRSLSTDEIYALELELP